ncbi:M48 family metallopeptidase [Candidatus Dependentiae bacterium]|nr:M48 family metallopeptidase [Candidatus Dependentiae bacterium]
MKESIKFGNKKIEFNIEYRKRKILEISVLPDSTVFVCAPENSQIEKIKEKVQKRASWILKQVSYFSETAPKVIPRKYISGETHRYLGKQYRLKIFEDKNENVKFIKGYIYITVLDKSNSEQIKKKLAEWYRTRMKIKFNERLNFCYEKLRKYGIAFPEWQIKSMRKRWGSCAKNGKILINPELIKVSLSCIDYVITHELCHLKYYTHDKKFYNFLSGVLPDWQKRKEQLEKSEI